MLLFGFEVDSKNNSHFPKTELKYLWNVLRLFVLRTITLNEVVIPSPPPHSQNPRLLTLCLKLG